MVQSISYFAIRHPHRLKKKNIDTAATEMVYDQPLCLPNKFFDFQSNDKSVLASQRIWRVVNESWERKRNEEITPTVVLGPMSADHQK